MKCLENLSLVDDECLEDLQKDIQAIIENYINTEKLCLETFEKIRKNIKVWHIIEIAQILNDVDSFWGMPIYTYKEDWEKDIRKFFDFSSEEDIENSIISIVKMFQELSQDDGIEFDLNANRYWIFRDGANAEAHIMREECFLDLIEDIIKYEEKYTQLRLLKQFKRIERSME